MTKQDAVDALTEARRALDFVAAEMTEETPDPIVVTTLAHAAATALRGVERAFGTGQLWLDFDDL